MEYQKLMRWLRLYACLLGTFHNVSLATPTPAPAFDTSVIESGNKVNTRELPLVLDCAAAGMTMRIISFLRLLHVVLDCALVFLVLIEAPYF